MDSLKRKRGIEMKICMLAPEFLPVWGGVGTYIIELVRHLPKNIQIDILTPMRRRLGKVKLSTSDYLISKYFGNNVKVHFICEANDTFIYNARFQYSCFKNVSKLLKEEKVDLIHSHTAHMPDLLLPFKKIDIPIVTTIHSTIRGQRKGAERSGMGFWDLDFSEKLTYLSFPFLVLVENYYFSKKRHYITVSNWMKKEIISQYPKIDPHSISVIYNSVDTELFTPNFKESPPDGYMVLYTGRLIASKGIIYLVKAMPKILREFPEVKFIFIGPGNPLPYLKKIKKMDISEKNYSFLGYLKEASDLVKYYRASSIYVAPTLYENLPIRILEAMACGVPVVATNVCAIPEVIDHEENGILIRPGDPNNLTDAICLLLDDQKLRRKIGGNARKTVLERFNWKPNAFKTVEIYRQILSNA